MRAGRGSCERALSPGRWARPTANPGAGANASFSGAQKGEAGTDRRPWGSVALPLLKPHYGHQPSATASSPAHTRAALLSRRKSRRLIGPLAVHGKGRAAGGGKEMTRPAASKPLLEPQAEAGPRPVGAAGGGRRSPAHGVCQGPGLNPGQRDGVASGSGDPATRKQRRGLGAAWGARRGGPALLRAGTQGPACVLLHGVILACASVANTEPGPGLGSSGAGGASSHKAVWRVTGQRRQRWGKGR